MKLLLENWRKIVEGEVIDFPQQPGVSDNIQRVNDLEDDVANLLVNIYGNNSQIPLPVLETMNTFIDSVGSSLGVEDLSSSEPILSKANTTFIEMVKDSVGRRLKGIYGEIPTEDHNKLDGLMNELARLLEE